MKSKLNSLIFISASIFATPVLACFAPSKEQTATWQELIKRTDTVIMAKVISAKPVAAEATSAEGDTRYTMKVLETLKGNPATSFEMVGFPSSKKTGDDFQAHQDEFFWKANSGRTIVSPDCTIKPTFIVGEKYLLFVEKPYHVKSFEKIAHEKDQWLQRVKTEITATRNEKN